MCYKRNAATPSNVRKTTDAMIHSEKNKPVLPNPSWEALKKKLCYCLESFRQGGVAYALQSGQIGASARYLISTSSTSSFLFLGRRWAEMKEGEPCTTLGALEFTGGCTGPEKPSALHDSAL